MPYIVEALDPQGKPVTFRTLNPQHSRSKATMLRVAGYSAILVTRESRKSGGLPSRNRWIRLYASETTSSHRLR